MNKASELFERVAKRCPFQPAGGNWRAWITREMDEAAAFDETRLKLTRDEEDENRRHAEALKGFAQRWQRLQQLCKHENVGRGTAEDDAVCRDCGATP